MPKKIKSVKKSRSSKPKSSGMIDICELQDILHEEQWKILQPKLDLINCEAKVEELEERLMHPDYYGDGYHHSPTLMSDLEMQDMAEQNADKMISELNAITGVFFGVTLSTAGWMMFILFLLVLASG